MLRNINIRHTVLLHCTALEDELPSGMVVEGHLRSMTNTLEDMDVITVNINLTVVSVTSDYYYGRQTICRHVWKQCTKSVCEP